MYRMFIIEDDAAIAQAIAKSASAWDIEARAAENLRNVMPEFAEFSPHIALIDISLPFFNGYHWCREIRRISEIPVLFISSASDNMNIITAMEMGADDFIAKPFDSAVLAAKIQAMLRRAYDFSASGRIIVHGDAMLDTDSNALFVNGARVELSKNEYRILLCLMENRNRPVSREKLMERLWSTDCFVDENTLTVNVNRLRRKLEAAGLHGFIGTRFGVGYIIE